MDYLRLLKQNDPGFDITKAYGRNYCTLIMAFIKEVDVNIDITVDGQKISTKIENARYQIVYRDYMNSNFFPFEHNCFYSTYEKAEEALSKSLTKEGYEKLDASDLIETVKRFEESTSMLKAKIK